MVVQESARLSDVHRIDYERRDVAWRPVLWVTAVSAAAILALMGGVTAMYWKLASKAPTEDEAMTSTPSEMARQLQELRLQEDERLGTYGWVSKEEGIIRIPIERAIDLWVEEQRDNR